MGNGGTQPGGGGDVGGGVVGGVGAGDVDLDGGGAGGEVFGIRRFASTKGSVSPRHTLSNLCSRHSLSS